MLRRSDPQQWLLAISGRELIEAVRVSDQIAAQYQRRYGNNARKSTRWHTPGSVQTFTHDQNRVIFTCEHVWVELTLLSPDTFRVRARTLDHNFSDPIINALNLQVRDDTGTVAIQSERLTINVEKARFHLRAGLLPNNRPICEDSGGIAWSDQGDVRVSLRLPMNDLVWGAGATNNVINLKGRRLRIELLDRSFTQRREVDNAFPPLIAGVNENGVLYHIAWHNTMRGWLDIGAMIPDELSFESESGELAYTFGCSALEATNTHRPELPPLWAFGFGFGGTRSTSFEQLPAHMQTFLQRDVPCSVVYLDEQKSALSPVQMKLLIDALQALNLRVVVQVAPTVPISTQPAHILHYPDGEPYVGAATLGAAFWIDFSHPDGIDTWTKRITACLRAGADGIMLTHTPASPLVSGGKSAPPPDFVRQQGGAHHECRSKDAQQAYASAIECIRQQQPQRRAVVQTRGLGDMIWLTLPTSWDGLRQVVPSALNAALAVPFVGAEVGAQTGEPDGELFTRWLQAGCLLPLLRAWSPTRHPLEPWAHGQVYQIANRITLKLRQRLLPYLYSLAALRREYHTPMIRPVFSLDLHDAKLREVSDAFMLGDLLVAPVLTKGVNSREVYLPKGDWFDYWSHERLEGGKSVRVPAPLERLPLFVRAGAVLPSFIEPNVLTLHAFPGERETILYEDAGEGYETLEGDYRWIYLTCSRIDNARLVIERRTAGRFQPMYNTINLSVMGLEHEPIDVRLDRQGAPLWFFDDGVLELKLDESFRRVEISHTTNPLDRTVPHRPL